jgi:hypothetical protein
VCMCGVLYAIERACVCDWTPACACMRPHAPHGEESDLGAWNIVHTSSIVYSILFEVFFSF